MNLVWTLSIKLMLALLIAFFVVSEGAAQTLQKIELKGTKPPARSGHTLANAGGKIILLGGDDGNFATSGTQVTREIVPQGLFNDVWQFNEGAVEFNEITPVNEKPKQVKFPDSVTHKGKIFNLFGVVEGVGFNSDAITFDPTSKLWEFFPTVGDDSCKNRTSVMLLGNGNIFALGGLGAASGTQVNFRKDNCKYNSIEEFWERLAQMPIGLTDAAVASFNDKIYVFGGRGETGLSDEVLEYDTTANTWKFVFDAGSAEGEITPQANEALLKRSHSAYVQAGNSLYMFGGRGENFQRLDDAIKIEFKADNTFTVRKLDVKFPAGFDSSSAALISLTPAIGVPANGLQTTSLQTAKILIFGGTVNPNNVTNDTFIFTDTVEATTPPAEECVGGPEVTSVTVGGKLKIKGNGFVEGLSLTLNGVGFNKLPVVENKRVVQKGLLTNGQSILDSCGSGCELKINNGDGRCTKVAAAPSP
jgi:hypothetical protein